MDSAYQTQIDSIHLRRIKLWFTFIFTLLISVFLFFFLSVINYLFSYGWLDFEPKQGLILGFVVIAFEIRPLIVLISVKSKLIFKIIDDKDIQNISVHLYNGQILRLNRNEPSLVRESSDWKLNSFLSGRNGIGLASDNKLEGFIITINEKKYYLIPQIFDRENIPI